jgi:hypothetical protein
MASSISSKSSQSLAAPAPALTNIRANQQASIRDLSPSSSLSSAEDDVCVVTTTDRMALPPKNRLFVYTSAFSDEENLQAALLLLKRYPHLFKIPSSGSEGSTKTIMPCAMVPSLETDDMAAAELLRQHPLDKINKLVANRQRRKAAPELDEEEHKPNIKAFLNNMIALPSCFNATKLCFTNCSCLKALVDYDAAAVQELWSIATMTKKEKEPVFKEWINTHDITSTGVSQGYGLRIGPNKGRVALCQNSFKTLLHLWRKRWNTLYCTRLHLGLNIHKNMGNTNSAVSQDTRGSVVRYLTDIANNLVRATQLDLYELSQS